MATEQAIFVQALLNEAAKASLTQRYSDAWALLEEAHIISQPFAGTHTQVHWRMLLLGVKTRSMTEIIGQLMRMLVAAPGSLSGKYPKGNTGRSNVSMFKPMPIPPKVAKKINLLDRGND